MPFSNFLLGETMISKPSNFKNLFIGVFGSRTIHASVIPISAVSGPVKHILAMSAPCQVDEETVGRFPIEVPTFMPRRARANKCLKHKSVNQPVKPLSFLNQSYRWAISAGAWAKNSLWIWFQDKRGADNPSTMRSDYNFTPIRPNTPLVTNFVSGESRNRFPSFRGIVNMVVSHWVALLHRVGFGVRAVSLRQQRCGLLCL